MPGLFITLEGIDGTGKTTQVKLLGEHYRNQGYDVVVTRAPGGCETAEAIRATLIQQDLEHKSELLLFLAALEEQYRKVIKPALKQNKLVITDRYIASTYAYQIYARGTNSKLPNFFTLTDLLNVKHPKATLLLDGEVDTALQRVIDDPNRKTPLTKWETKEFLTLVKEGYHAYAELNPNDVLVVNKEVVMSDIESLNKQLISIVDLIIGNNNYNTSISQN